MVEGMQGRIGRDDGCPLQLCENEGASGDVDENKEASKL